MRKTLFLLFLMTYLSMIAQDDHFEKVNTEQVNLLSDQLDYEKTKTGLVPRDFLKSNTKKEVKNSEPWQPKFNFGTVFEILMYLIGGMLILFILYVLVKDIKFKKKDLGHNKVELDHITDIEAVNFNSLLEEAIASGDYRLAVRIRFLKVLQNLSKNNFIKWKPDKTNRTYVRELEGNGVGPSFKEISFVFENIWYGNSSIDLPLYQLVAYQFDQIENTIKS